MIVYFNSESDKIDFRRATPLLIGLNNLYQRQMAFLLKDSQFVLKEMTEPVAVIKDDSTAHTRPKQGSSYSRLNNNFKLNTKQFDWFLDGIDKRQLDALQSKLDLTMVRDGTVEDIREQVLLQPELLSEIRQIADENEGGFEHLIGYMDADMNNILGLPLLQSPFRLEEAFNGFGLEFES